VYVTFAVQLVPPPFGVHVGVPIVPSDPCVGPVPIANVNDALSTSVAARVISFAVSSAVVTLCGSATGVLFTAVTVIETVAAVEFKDPSLATNVKLSGPL